MTNGERIKFLREKNRLTQKDVATRLGVESAAISKYELDMREPNIEAIKKLANLFNVSIDYLLGRTPDVFVNENDKVNVDISIICEKYNIAKSKIKSVKDIYTNENAIIIAANKLCSGVGKTVYGESIVNKNISINEIEAILENIEESKNPKPQLLMKIKDLKNSIIIVEIDSYDDEIMPINATDRMELYTAKFSKKYNVLGLSMIIDKNENCKIIDAIYQKNNEPYFIQLHLPKTVLTVGEYVDIIGRI